MSLTGHRVEGFRIEQLTKSEAVLGDLYGITGGQLTWNANADIPGGGSIRLVETIQDVNYSQDRVRIWCMVNDEEWPLGVFLLAAPSRKYTGDGSTRDITLIDKLSVIKDDVLTETFQVAVGANLVDAAVGQVLAAGEEHVAVTNSAAKATNAMTWEPGTPRLTVVNDLLTAAGYWALWTDRQGQFCFTPYIAPADRPISYEFIEGAASIHSPDWEYKLSLWEACNRVVMVSQEDDAGNVWYASATDDNPASPTSTVSMGRVLNPIVEENVEAASQADLQAQATRKLLDNSNVVGKINVSHATVPVWFNESVHFVSQGMDATATITRMTMKLEAGALMSAEWRQVS